MSEETNKKQNEEVSDKKLESAAGGLGFGQSLDRLQRQKCPICGRMTTVRTNLFVRDGDEQIFCCERCRTRNRGL